MCYNNEGVNVTSSLRVLHIIRSSLSLSLCANENSMAEPGARRQEMKVIGNEATVTRWKSTLAGPVQLRWPAFVRLRNQTDWE